MVKDLIIFYFFFELSLVPIIFLILKWGVQSERIEAGFYFIIYALIGSLPLLAKILFLSDKVVGEFGFFLLYNCQRINFFFFLKKKILMFF
jgi:NADH:ubiquinone oxidoreductase subunit 4 (subunit M)